MSENRDIWPGIWPREGVSKCHKIGNFPGFLDPPEGCTRAHLPQKPM